MLQTGIYRPKVTTDGIAKILTGELKGKQREEDPKWFDFQDLDLMITPQEGSLRVSLCHKGTVVATWGDIRMGIGDNFMVQDLKVTIAMGMDAI